MQLFSFLKKEFVKNVLTLITGSALSQVVIYGSILLLTRLFSTELFGVYMLFTSSVLVLKPIITLQLELAIILPKKDEEAINIFVMSIIAILILSILLLVTILIFKTPILSFFEIEKLSYLIYFIPFSTFLFGCITSLNYWNNRSKKFKNIANGTITKSTVMSASQIAIGYSSLNNLGLVPGMILGQISQLLFLFKNSSKSISKLKNKISFSKMLFLAKKYKDIPLFNTLINFLNTLSNEIPVLMITKYFGLSSAGIYGLAIKIGRAPSGIVQDSISQVFFNKATEVYNKEEKLYKTVKKTFKNLLRISFLIFIPLTIISYFLDIIFGEEWTYVGTYLRILIPWLFIMFLSSPISSLIVILNKQKVILFYDILLLTFRFLALYFGYHYYNDILISLIMFSAIGVLFNIFILFYFFKITKTENKNSTIYN
ncbi:lipopolysaccharide biosynthesis protein [Polaribacter glomeratus]|uniref:O-antigen translocase n=1 Tax=Polaribacter glomeratus TaxID=102 RepID=A0A2S7WZ36_9FLAO|nr:oligosaccharide flippase family protein [Polaribacter glomeratus]PQJ82582.1 O-antigen translocase [Polaribacter glomeratus]TXD64962.1 oligosaccharide flippase family protein [Polaribacter glomeratus]